LPVLAKYQVAAERRSQVGIARRTLALAILRGALLDLPATGDDHRTGVTTKHQVALLDH
jgi:hypothetical protein